VQLRMTEAASALNELAYSVQNVLHELIRLYRFNEISCLNLHNISVSVLKHSEHHS
jgi:hypothetical protein